MTRVSVSRRWPRAQAVCDRCGFRFNHSDLQWQFEWRGPSLVNTRVMVCRTCLDKHQEQLRTIILPPDPVPIQNPRPEQFEADTNTALTAGRTIPGASSMAAQFVISPGNAAIGQAALPSLPGSNIGTLNGGGGTYAAFVGGPNKSFNESANLAVSGSSWNWVGKDWSFLTTTATPDPTTQTTVTLVAEGFAATSPSDAPFLASGATSWAFQASDDASTWLTIVSGTTSSAVAQTISNANINTGTPHRYHRFAVLGDGSAVAIAQLAINTNRGTSILG